MILDSNIVIYAAMPAYEELRHFLRKYEDELAISAITKLEVLGYHKLQVNEKITLAKFFDAIRQIPISESVIDQAITLRQLQNISTGDAIIAATALIEDDLLLTNNEDDFRNIASVKILPLKTLNKDR